MSGSSVDRLSSATPSLPRLLSPCLQRSVASDDSGGRASTPCASYRGRAGRGLTRGMASPPRSPSFDACHEWYVHVCPRSMLEAFVTFGVIYTAMERRVRGSMRCGFYAFIAFTPRLTIVSVKGMVPHFLRLGTVRQPQTTSTRYSQTHATPLFVRSATVPSYVRARRRQVG